MSEAGKNLSVKIMNALKAVLPKKTAFVMAFISEEDEDMGLVCNVNDDIALMLLEDGIKSIEEDPAEDIEEDVKPSNQLN